MYVLSLNYSLFAGDLETIIVYRTSLYCLHISLVLLALRDVESAVSYVPYGVALSSCLSGVVSLRCCSDCDFRAWGSCVFRQNRTFGLVAFLFGLTLFCRAEDIVLRGCTVVYILLSINTYIDIIDITAHAVLRLLISQQVQHTEAVGNLPN